MNPCDEEVEGERRECCKNGLHERLAPCAIRTRCPVYAMEQLRGRDRSYRHLVVRAEALLQAAAYGLHCAVGGGTARGALELDENSGV